MGVTSSAVSASTASSNAPPASSHAPPASSNAPPASSHAPPASSHAPPASSQALSLRELQNPQTFQLGESCAAPAAKRKTTRADFEAASRRRGEVKVSDAASSDPFSSLDPLWSGKK